MNVNKLIEKGDDALKKRNYDYAISIFLEAVSFAPNNRRAREGLRKAELKKYENNYPSAGVIAIFGLGARFGMLVAGLSRKSNPEGFMMACERFLTKDPKNKGVNIALGDAAAEAGHLDAAILALETASEHHPHDTVALKKLGNLLWKNGEINRAHATFDKVVKLDPTDQEAVKSRKNLAAEASLKETGFETASSSQDLVKDKDAAGKLEREARLYASETDLHKKKEKIELVLQSEPENVAAIQDLAQVFEKLGDHKTAMETMDRAIAVRPTDLALQFARGDLEMNHLEEEIRQLKAEGKVEEAAADERQLLETRIEEYRKRIKAYPTDLKLRYTLGNLLFEKGEFEAAIGEYQQTFRDPRFKTISLMRLGKAFAEIGKYDLAIRQLTQALEGHTTMSDDVKEIIYDLANVHERTGDKDKAKKEFNKIYEVDIGFRDVGDRLAKLDSAD
jgi:tetratricopeptide (TPR) repeat protein